MLTHLLLEDFAPFGRNNLRALYLFICGSGFSPFGRIILNRLIIMCLSLLLSFYRKKVETYFSFNEKYVVKKCARVYVYVYVLLVPSGALFSHFLKEHQQNCVEKSKFRKTSILTQSRVYTHKLSKFAKLAKSVKN